MIYDRLCLRNRLRRPGLPKEQGRRREIIGKRAILFHTLLVIYINTCSIPSNRIMFIGMLQNNRNLLYLSPLDRQASTKQDYTEIALPILPSTLNVVSEVWWFWNSPMGLYFFLHLGSISMMLSFSLFLMLCFLLLVPYQYI